MAHDAATRQARLREAILGHIKRNPLAADTANGILACWLPCSGFEDAPDHIDAVLHGLVDDHWLQARQLPDGSILYAARRPGDKQVE